MQVLLGLFLLLATACAIAQQKSTALTAPNLPDAPSHSVHSPSTDSSSVRLSSPAIASATAPPSSISRRYLDFAAPTTTGNSSLIFAGNSAATEASGPSASSQNCAHASAGKSDSGGWITSLVSLTSKGGHYCALGEGGFWKRGTYAMSRAFVAHKYDSANSFAAYSTPGSGFAAGYGAYPGYTYPYDAGQRLATRYASAIGRDTLRNMFREFWPDISFHLQHRHP